MPTFPTYRAFVIILVIFEVKDYFLMPLIEWAFSLNSVEKKQEQVLQINKNRQLIVDGR